jgi:murein L,D-transpeptidase YafK
MDHSVMSRRKSLVVLLAAVVVAAGSYALYIHFRALTVADAVRIYGAGARMRLAPYFRRAPVAYPPKRIALLAFKKERRVALWASDGKSWHFIRGYPILAASGNAGPKLRQGDYQVPEGLYRIAWLNPASSYHLSMKVDYPNASDRRQAALDRRTNLGGDIFIHGKNVSIGCIAIGDPAIEELFTLAADTGPSAIRVIIAPNDLRAAGAPLTESTPAWVAVLYRTIAVALAEFPLWMESNSAMDIRGMRKAAKVLSAR